MALNILYQAAGRARHLLDDDQHWDSAMAEACVSDSPRRLRHFFAVLLLYIVDFQMQRNFGKNTNTNWLKIFFSQYWRRNK